MVAKNAAIFKRMMVKVLGHFTLYCGYCSVVASHDSDG